MFDRFRLSRRTLAALLFGAPAAAVPVGDKSLDGSQSVAPPRSKAIVATDFGAKGDGRADDTAAIQAALDYAGQRSIEDAAFDGFGYVRKGGATVHLPAGEYRTTATLSVPQNVSIEGDGRHASVIRSTATAHVLRNDARSSTQGTYDRSGIALRNFGIIGDRSKPRQVGIGLLRAVGARIDNVHVSKCGLHGIELLQVGCSSFSNVECVRNGGHGLDIGQGKDDWDKPANAWPSNANLFETYRATQNDGAGVRLGRASNGNMFLNAVCEYNGHSGADNAGFNVVSASDGYVPNIFHGLWTEGPVESHVLVENNDISTALELVNWRHFGNGASGNVNRALIVRRGTVRLRGAVSPAASYRRIAGSIAPFRLASLQDAIIHVTDASGALVAGLDMVEGPDGKSSGLENNLRQRGFDVVYGPLRHYGADGSVAADEWYTDRFRGDPYLRIEPFHKALAFGDGRAAPDVMLKRTGARTLGLDNRGGGQFFDHGSMWNGGHLKMGNHHLWVDSAGVLRIKEGMPNGDTDGMAVGTQGAGR